MSAPFSSPLANDAKIFTVPRATYTGDIMVMPHRHKRWIPRTVVTPDYTNQLDLFSEAPIDTETAPAASDLVRKTGSQHARPRPPEQLDFGALESLPPVDAPAIGAGQPPPDSAQRDSGTFYGSPVRTDVGPENRLHPSLGDDDRRDSPAGRVLLDEPDQPSRDFRITDAHRIGQGGLREKARDNIAAIRLLKTLESENRDATEDEKATLARYVGWGGMPGIFESSYRRREEWNKPAEELASLLTDTEYESARASTPNAHFTSPQGITAIWDGLQRIGVAEGAQILEPAMGAGHFFGLMPEYMQGGHKTGIELDSITARIAQKLYPD